MQLGEGVLDSMGFEKVTEENPIEAVFKLSEVFWLQGISLKDITTDNFSDLSFRSEEFSFAFGNNLNEICNALIQEDYVSDEETWKKEKKVGPPYLLINISLKEPLICTKGHWKREKEGITTYDSFPEARKLLREIKRKVIPPLISSLSINLSNIHSPIRFKPIDQQVYGKTKSNEYVFDFRFETSVRGFTSRNATAAKIKECISESLKIFKKIDPKVSSLFYSALNEEDRFKQFLNLFQSLEIFTHKEFKKIGDSKVIEKITNVPDRIKSAGNQFFLERQAESKNLTQRFLWCSLLLWERISDEDVEAFRSIKKTRDELAHGESIPETILPNEKLENLMLKIMQPEDPL